MSVASPYPLADLALARRLERTEAQSSLEFVDARAMAFPESRAQWMEEAGTFAMFDGLESPLTQTFGLGIAAPVTPRGLDRIESFYADLGAPVFHEVSPLADASALTLLCERNYEPFEFTSVMFQPIGDSESEGLESNVRVRIAGAEEMELWATTSARGWDELQHLSDFLLTFGRVSARKASGHSFLAYLDGLPIGAGGLTIHQGTALFAGASTIPEARRKGAQTALLKARLRFAREQGCDVAMMCALPGSSSQKNAERRGFRIAYTRIKWRQKSQTLG